MKADIIEKIIQAILQLGTLGISAFAFVSAVHAFVKERSVGKTALNKLKEEHEIIKRDVDILKRENAEKAEDISAVQKQYERLIEKILSNFPFKN